MDYRKAWKDIEGYTNGRLTAVSYVGTGEYGHHLWKCRCSCGKTIIERGADLLSDRVRSCGCGRRKVK